MRKGGERTEKRRQKRDKKFEEKDGLRKPSFLEFSRYCFFKSSGYDKLKCGFHKLIECIIKKICHGVKICRGMKHNVKICAIGETECNET